jgi:hypothetical protein
MAKVLDHFFPHAMHTLIRKFPEKYWDTQIPPCAEYPLGIYVDLFGLAVHPNLESEDTKQELYSKRGRKFNIRHDLIDIKEEKRGEKRNYEKAIREDDSDSEDKIYEDEGDEEDEEEEEELGEQYTRLEELSLREASEDDNDEELNQEYKRIEELSIQEEQEDTIPNLAKVSPDEGDDNDDDDDHDEEDEEDELEEQLEAALDNENQSDDDDIATSSF